MMEARRHYKLVLSPHKGLGRGMGRELDLKFMKMALLEAKKAFDRDEVPVGAVVVHKGGVLAKAHNLKEQFKDATKHAEILALEKSAKALGQWRLTDCTLYVTLEPCPMCAGALVQARVGRVVIGAKDPKSGACGSVLNITQHKKLNHHIEVEFGVGREECSQILKDFFESKRG